MLFNTFTQIYSAMPGQDRYVSFIKQSHACKISNEQENSNQHTIDNFFVWNQSDVM